MNTRSIVITSLALVFLGGILFYGQKKEVPPGGAPPSSLIIPKDWVTYKDERCRFEVSYPKSLETEDTFPHYQPGIQIFHPDGKTSIGFVCLRLPGGSYQYGSLLEKNEPLLDFVKKRTTNTGIKPFALNGMTGYVSTFTNEKISYEGTEIFLEYQERVYAISYQDEESEPTSLYDEVIATFRPY